MRKVILASLAGNAYQLEEAAHQRIASYLDDAGRALVGNPDRAEILSDLEQAIADKCDSFLGKHKNVVSDHEAMQILREMGPVLGNGAARTGSASADWAQPAAESAEGAGSGAPGASTYGSHSGIPRRRLMRLPSEGMMGGVCAGIAAYLNFDVVWVRLAFVLITVFTWSAWILVWLAMLIVMPAARTPEQMATARGEALSAREVMEMAKKKSAEMAGAAAQAARDVDRNLRDTFGRRS